MIDSHSCGQIHLGIPVYGHLSGTYTPAATGAYTLEIDNQRSGIQKLLYNYIDDITLVPQTTDFSSDTIQFQVSTANQAAFSLDAGAAYAGAKYLVLLSTSGNWPGITNNGHWVPLNMDGILMWSMQHANSAMLPHTKATLDASGHAVAGLKLFNPMSATWLGRTINVAYVLYQGPSPVPIGYGSMPVTILFIP